MLPDPPSCEHDERSSALPELWKGGADGRLPPICEEDIRGRRDTSGLDPRKYLMPQRAGEGATDQEVVWQASQNLLSMFC